jgi:hypothetical protein
MNSPELKHRLGPEYGKRSVILSGSEESAFADFLTVKQLLVAG